jgi:hypothetical protein
VEACTLTGCKKCDDTIATCTACNEAAPEKWFMGQNLAGVATCYSKSTIPIFLDGFGPKVGTATVAPCTLTNCRLCPDTVDTCDACKNLQGWYLGTKAGTTDKECQSATTAPLFPTGYGPNLVSLLVEQCTLANCGECNDNKDGCTKCDTANKWFLGTSAGKDQCQKAGDASAGFPAGFGPNLSNGKVEACTLTGCKKCDDTIATCTACQTSGGWYMGVDLTGAPQCQHATNTPVFPSGYGPSTDGLTVSTCTKANCIKCPSIVSTCTACTSGYFVKADEGTCYDKDTFPTGYGGVATNTPPDVKQCLVSSCDKCGLDITKCIQCSGGLYADQISPACLTQAQLDAKTGYGKVTTNTYNQVTVCSSPGCTNCVEDISLCKLCSSGYFFLAATSKCYDELSIPDNYGKLLVPGDTPTTLDSCTLPNCKQCKQDRTVCGGCIDSHYWKSSVPSCVSTIEAGFGLIPLTTIREIAACVPGLNCETCDDDNTKCKTCATGFIFEPISAKCYDETNIPQGFGRDTSVTSGQATIKACKDTTNCNLCEADYTKCAECKTPKYVYAADGACYASGSFPPNTGIVPQTGGSTLLKIDDCTLNGCGSCTADYSVCLGCKASWYFDKVNTVCYDTMPPQKGLVKGTTINEIKLCTVTNCQKCTADNTVCDECIVQAPKLYLDDNTCTRTIQDGKGIDTSIVVPTLKPCTDSIYCIKCADNIDVCTRCAAAIYLYAGTCITAITGSKGKDTAAPFLTLKDCKDPKCSLCADNYEVCTQCSPGVYLDGTTCTSPIPAGKGVVTSAAVLTIAPCQDSTNCAVCEADNTICTDCNNNMYLDETICVSTITDGKGLDLSIPTRTLKACTDTTNCAKCSADYTKCSECKNSLFVKADDWTCVASASKYGKDLTAAVLTLKPCTDTNCEVCTDNNQICTQCPAATSLLAPDQGKCYLFTDTVPTGYGKKVVSGSPPTLVPCFDTKCSNCVNSYDTCTKCIDNYSFDATNKCTPSQNTNRDPVATLDPIPMFEEAPNTFGFAFVGKKITENILSYFYAILKNSDGKNLR